VTYGKELLAVSIIWLLSYKQPSSVCEDGEEIFLRLRLIANKTIVISAGKRRRPISFSTLLVTSHGDDCIIVSGGKKRRRPRHCSCHRCSCVGGLQVAVLCSRCDKLALLLARCDNLAFLL
jgi:hypothetical protein